MKSKAALMVLVLVTLASCRAAWSGQEFGRASLEELEMTSIPEAPDADAIVLFDIGAVTPDVFARHRRVKVLTKRGTESANVSIPFYKGDKIRDLEGCTITRDGKRLWLDSKQVFTKKGKDWNEMVFTLPGVEEGCVFEYRYSKRTKYTYVLGPWYFQNKIFTRLSQVTLRLEGGWLYSYFFRNAGKANTEPRMVDVYGGMEYIWTFENVPPIKEEPYVACLNDYRTGIYFEQSGWKNAYSKDRDPIDTWGELGELAEKIYEGFKYDKSKIKKKASQLTEEVSSDSAKAERIYDFVRGNIEWNGERGIFNLDEKSFRKILKRMEGTATEVNFLLMKLLQQAEIETEAVLISTRDNGKILKLKPGLIQFDHFIVRVKLGDGYWYLDAVEKLCPFGMLPKADLSQHGLLLDGLSSRIIQLPVPKVISKRHIITTGTVAEDGGFACSSLVSYTGYPDFAVRERIQEKGEDEFVRDEFLASIPAAVMHREAVAWPDSVHRPLEINIDFSAPQYVQIVAGDWYINPTLFSRLESNPFESEERRFTVDFGYPFSHIEDTELHIPEGFKIKNSPGTVFRSISGAEFRKTFSFEENKVRCHRELRVSKLTFPVSQYGEIRDFYEEIVRADQLRIVLTPKP